MLLSESSVVHALLRDSRPLLLQLRAMVWLCTVRDGQEAYLRSAHCCARRSILE
jgi:hypothetical protein